MATVNRQRWLRTGTLSAGVVLLAALLAILNYFGAKYYKRFDWTRSKLYTLSDQTRDVLSKLNSDIQITGLLPTNHNLYEPTRELLDRYAAVSRRLHVRMVDPERNRLETTRLAQQYHLTNFGVVVARGEDRRVIDPSELADFDYSGVQEGLPPEMTGYKGEQQITSAVLQVSEGRKPKVLFTTGHGEHSLDDRQPNGLAEAQAILAPNNFQVEEWASLGKKAVPPGTDLVVIAGPTSTFLQPEIDALTAYVNGGGRLLVMLDPVLKQAGGGLVPSGLEDWLAGYGVKVGQDLVFDPANELPTLGNEFIFVKDWTEHPITKALHQGGLPVLVVLARSVSKGNPPAGTEVTELVKTSAQGWGETDFSELPDHVVKDAKDLAGPVSVAVAVEKKAGAAALPGAPAPRPIRLVVIGNSYFATNQLLRANAPNSFLLGNSLNWLIDREALLSIPAKSTQPVHLSLLKGQFYTILALVIGLLPGLAIAAGVTVYLKRRR